MNIRNRNETVFFAELPSFDDHTADGRRRAEREMGNGGKLSSERRAAAAATCVPLMSSQLYSAASAAATVAADSIHLR